ncbi:MAG: phosphate/phosphite/phosphonate ABC transporter substrate-binding protein [Nitrospinae bacterium]|nr:phosphate/phosphite/phosphonate ABC transporter substrate-binding protein [Nitrospinota bacterium]MBF0633216.1 phosphate/phosphite/phosphonate ABC transporter substrate-binding protein [Nitrospinota bacterium]
MKKLRLVFLCAAILAATVLSTVAEEKTLAPKLRFGLTAVTLEKNLSAHKRLVNLIEDKLGVPVEIVSRKSYQEMSFLLSNGQVDFAFVCGLPYVLDHDKFGLELLAVPVFKGKPVYQSYLITHKSSPYASLKDLRGKTFCFSDPLSNSGYLAPVFNLHKIGETPQSFFRSHFFSYSHYNCIEAVSVKLADAANVDSYVWETANTTSPEQTDQTKVIEKSEYMPITPMVVRPGLPEPLKRELRGVFLNMGQSRQGRLILEMMQLGGFAVGRDSDYDAIRAKGLQVSKSVAVEKK